MQITTKREGGWRWKERGTGSFVLTEQRFCHFYKKANLAHSTKLYGCKNKKPPQKRIRSEGQRQPPPGTVDANLCISRRGETRPHGQQLAETKAHTALQFKCPQSATE